MAAATKFSPSGASNTASNSHCRRRTNSANPTTQQRNVSVLPPPGPPTGYARHAAGVRAHEPADQLQRMGQRRERLVPHAFHRLLIRLAHGRAADQQGRQETGGQEDIENDPGRPAAAARRPEDVADDQADAASDEDGRVGKPDRRRDQGGQPPEPAGRRPAGAANGPT